MPKLMRTFVLGAMLAVLSSATAAVAHAAPPDQAVHQVRTGERAPLGQPVSNDQAAPSAQPADRGTPVALLAALAAAAVLALSLDALAVRRETRKSAARFPSGAGGVRR